MPCVGCLEIGIEFVRGKITLQELKKWDMDVAVLCIFFARPNQFRQCFEQVKKARPRYLLLWQDGPRPGREDDVCNIQLCREIAEDIDWECEVYRNYHTENMGCDPSTFNSHQWAFSIVDKCIILEDDLVPSQSFFHFCKEMLDKYEYDTRIDRICGTNALGMYTDTPYDYFFSTRGHSWGWASWKRVADTWNRNYEFLNDEYTIMLLKEQGIDPKQQKKWLNRCKMHQEQGVPYWEEIIGARALLYNGLIIYPKYNLVKNVGLDDNSTHTVTEIKSLPKSVQQYFMMDAHDLTFPLKHPPYVMKDTIFEKKCREAAHPSKLTAKIRLKMESVYRKIKTGTFWSTVKRHVS